MFNSSSGASSCSCPYPAMEHSTAEHLAVLLPLLLLLFTCLICLALCEKRKRVRVLICDDVLLDCFPFLEREQHLSLKLVNRRFFHLSTLVHKAKRYPKATWRWFSIQEGKSAGFWQPIVGNTIWAYSKNWDLCALEFPDQAPPAQILPFHGHISIHDWKGKEVLNFLRLCSGRLFNCCEISFCDFANFTGHCSLEFFVDFLALFPSIRSMRFSNATRNQECFFGALSGRTNQLCVYCAADFPLECLLDWLYAPNPNGSTKRCLYIYDVQTEKAIGEFTEAARKMFLSASQPCPFHVRMEYEPSLFTFLRSKFLTPDADGPLLQEPNAQTGERLTLEKRGNSYTMERRVPGQYFWSSQCSCAGTEHPSIRIFDVLQGHF